MPSYQNTKSILGSDEAAFNALVAHQLTEFNDDSITEVGQYGFYKQNTLQSIYLPKCKIIGNNAFSDCTVLQRIFIGLDNSTVATCSGGAFNNTGRAIIYVPDELVSNYRSASNWSAYAGRIFGVSSAATGENEWNETEITDTPEQIASYVSAGTAASRYKLGQYKTIDLGAQGQIRMQIVGKNCRELASSTDTAQLDWLAMDLLVTNHKMNDALNGTTAGTGAIGPMTAEYNSMQAYLDTTIWTLVPSVWQNMIKETKQITTSYNTSGTKVTNDVTTSKLRIPSYREVGLGNLETQGPVYSLAFPDNTSRIRKKIGSSSATYWWLRSASDTSYFCLVNYSGNYTSNYASTEYGVALAFST